MTDSLILGRREQYDTIVDALTIQQPWASLIVEGFKSFEVRGWPLPARMFGKRIVIHAAKRPIRIREIVEIRDYVLSDRGRADGIKVGAADLLDKVFRGEITLPVSAGIGTAELAPSKSVGTPDFPNFAWPMLHVCKWEKPVGAVGARMFWCWPTELEEGQ